jgi:hypothetical protein
VENQDQTIELFPCKCCGNLLIMHLLDRWVDIACSMKHINDPCSNFRHLCEIEKTKCALNEEDIIENENKLFDQIIQQISLNLDKSKLGDCFLRFDSRRILYLFARFPKQWLCGNLEDEAGKYYRIFKSKEYYKQGLIEHVRRYGMTPELMQEFYRLGIATKEV